MPRSILLGRPVPGPGEPLFLPEDTAAVMALALEEADTCRQCGQPKAWCRNNEVGRRRFDVSEEFCWATYRVGQRKAKRGKENVEAAAESATLTAVKFRPGYEPDLLDGLEVAPPR